MLDVVHGALLFEVGCGGEDGECVGAVVEAFFGVGEVFASGAVEGGGAVGPDGGHGSWTVINTRDYQR